MRDVRVRGRRVRKAERRLTPTQITQLIADYEAGLPSTELMVTYNLGKATVLRILRNHGVKLRNIDQAIEHYAAGWSLKRLGEQYGCNVETVRKALLAAGVTVRKRNGWQH